MSVFKSPYCPVCNHTVGITYVNCVYSGCDYVGPLTVCQCQYDCSCGNVPHICVVKAIFMHAKERNLLNSVCTFAFLSNKVNKIFRQVNCIKILKKKVFTFESLFL